MSKTNIWLAICVLTLLAHDARSDVIKLKPGSGFVAASKTIGTLPNSARDLWWNGEGLVPGVCGYSAGVFSALKDLRSVDARNCEFGEMSTTPGETFVFGIDGDSAHDYVVVRVVSIDADRGLTVEWSEAKLPAINERPCPGSDVLGTWHDRRCLVCAVPTILPPELGYTKEEIRKCLVVPKQVLVTTGNGVEQVRALADPRGTLIEGDIRLHPNQMATVARGTGRTSIAARWPGGRVPFTIDGSIADNPSDPDDVFDRVQWAVNHWNTLTAIRLVQVTPTSGHPCGKLDEDCVTFKLGAGCDSSVGRVGGQQIINLTTGCDHGSVAHEIGHSIGLFHEQSAEHRDSFVRILDGNILDSAKYNFDKFSSNYTDGLDYSTYDYGSIMHYGATAFSKNGKPTIQRLDGLTVPAMGQRAGLSDLDRAAVEAMYGSFAFSYRGSLEGRRCIKLNSGDPDGWSDNYFCANKDGAVWSKGSLANARCVKVDEPSDSNFETNNFLCFPFAWRERFTWSRGGPIAGMRCISFNEPSDHDSWGDNFLCWSNSAPEDSTYKNVAVSFSNIDDDAYMWTGDSPSDNKNAVCFAKIDHNVEGTKTCSLTEIAKNQGLATEARFIVKFGNGGGFESEGKFDILVDNKSVFSRRKNRVTRHTGWFYRVVLLIDFVRGTVRVFDEKQCNDIFECAN